MNEDELERSAILGALRDGIDQSRETLARIRLHPDALEPARALMGDEWVARWGAIFDQQIINTEILIMEGELMHERITSLFDSIGRPPV